MKLAIMQPYLFPYIGYFQLAAAVDKFVFYDDVNFIKNGWINRNRMLLGDQVRYLTVPLRGASPSLKINEVLVEPRERWLRKLLESIRHAYAKAPHYAQVSALVGRILAEPLAPVSQLASHTVMEICKYLEIDTEFVPSSTKYGNAQLKGAERVIDICAREHASTYVNLPGGRALYDSAAFLTRGVELAFVEPNLCPYTQFDDTFHPALSILDVLMFNSKNSVRDMLCVEVNA
ncbi:MULTISPECIES: WbqC family protein [unclassified Paraburkholderia]|uniref:WbqC family protein n=1 Tax=unclassified Paraburkholderia TaxID=2615204 RepID=UPI000E226ACC|nr:MULTISPECIES: WbqC family protein [unclassified Paraburkholderia]REE20884.1 WbqC-like protein [Paraburkholderia sp. BL27I4N3]RKR43765.1 WbqC-like protein [Paraburkholderia sp. BL17N1]